MADIRIVDYEDIMQDVNITFEDRGRPGWGDKITLNGVKVMIQKVHSPCDDDNPVYLLE